MPLYRLAQCEACGKCRKGQESGNNLYSVKGTELPFPNGSHLPQTQVPRVGGKDHKFCLIMRLGIIPWEVLTEDETWQPDFKVEMCGRKNYKMPHDFLPLPLVYMPSIMPWTEYTGFYSHDQDMFYCTDGLIWDYLGESNHKSPRKAEISVAGHRRGC